MHTAFAAQGLAIEHAPAAQPAFVQDMPLKRLQAVNVVVVAWDRKTCGAIVVTQPCCALAEPVSTAGANRQALHGQRCHMLEGPLRYLDRITDSGLPLYQGGVLIYVANAWRLAPAPVCVEPAQRCAVSAAGWWSSACTGTARLLRQVRLRNHQPPGVDMLWRRHGGLKRPAPGQRNSTRLNDAVGDLNIRCKGTVPP